MYPTGIIVNSFNSSSGQTKISRKILNFTFSNATKEIVPSKSTAEEISFEWHTIGFIHRLKSWNHHNCFHN